MKFEVLVSLQNNDGFTMKNGEIIRYKSGWQVADYGYETANIDEAYAYIVKMEGNCGVWYADGVYYVDHSFRVNTKREALEIGRAHAQISIYGWKRGNLAYC